MVIIRETISSSGGRQIRFIDQSSNSEQVWCPPRNLEKSKQDAAMYYAASLFGNAVSKQSDPLPIADASDLKGDATLQEYTSQIFMPRKELRISDNTRASWQGLLRLRTYPRLGQLRLNQIDTTHIDDFILGLQKEGLSVATVKKYRMLLSLIMDTVVRRKWIKVNPVKSIEQIKPRKDEMLPQIEAYTALEIAYIQKCLANEPVKWRAYVGILIDTGVRRGELLALTWEDIDFRNQTIFVHQSIGYTPDVGIFVGTTKNHRWRTLDLCNEMMQLLLELYSKRNPVAHFVFTQKDGVTPMFPTSPGAYLRKFGKRYGIKDMHPHRLRHSYASCAILAGADIASVSENLGHKNKSVTLDMYTSASDESKRKASNTRREAVRNATAQ